MLKYMYVYTQINKYVYMFLCYTCVCVCIISGKSVFVSCVYSFRAAYCIGVLPILVCIKVGLLKVSPFHLYMSNDITVFPIIFVQSFLGKIASYHSILLFCRYIFFFSVASLEMKRKILQIVELTVSY